MNENIQQLPFVFKLGKAFKKYMNNNIATSVVPSIVSITGAFFFNFNVAGATIMNQLGLFSGMANSMYPKLNSSFLEDEIDLIEAPKENPKKEIALDSSNDTVKKIEERSSTKKIEERSSTKKIEERSSTIGALQNVS